MSEQSPITVRILRSLEEVERIRDIWTAMQQCPESDIDFYSFIVNTREEILRPYVIVVYQGNAPISIFAGRVEDSCLDIQIGYKVIWRAKVRRIANFYGGFMGQTSVEIAEVVVRQLLRSMRDEGADLILWNGVLLDSPVSHIMRRAPNPLCRDYLPLAIDHWKMSMPASLEEMLEQRMNKKHRYWARRMIRMLEKDFTAAVRYACFSRTNELDQLSADVMKVAKKTYQWGLGVGFQDTKEQRERLRLEAGKGWLRGYVLYLQNEPVAYWICILYQNSVHLVSTGYDPALAKYEVGTVLLLHVIGEMSRDNVKQMDFGIGAALYKERFGDILTKESVVHIFALGFRGVALNAFMFLTAGVLGLARKAVRSLGAEERLKKLWRARVTPIPDAIKPVKV